MGVNGGGAWRAHGKMKFCQLFNCSANLNPAARVNPAISFSARIRRNCVQIVAMLQLF
jgi:hypothetical protein